MSAHEADIAVIGAGPAGSSCAATLAGLGYDVLLVDQNEFPRDKPCGDGLTPHAVEMLHRLGLGEQVDAAQPIEGLRIMIDHRRERVASFDDDMPGRCMPRSQLDNAIFDSALARGARFVRGYVHGLDTAEGFDKLTVLLRAENEETRLIARRVVAADGPTSVMRRSAGMGTPGHSVRAWAVRAYYETGCALEPRFMIYLPLEVNGTTLVGYGWVFPVSEHVANIGVGELRPSDVGPMPPLTGVLDAFVGELALRHSAQFAEIGRLGRPIGSPLGINFDPARCSKGNLLLVGDAAGITDPITGEGIALALESGVAGAECVDSSLRDGISLERHGEWLARTMPRSGQNFSSIARAVKRRPRGLKPVTSDELKRMRFVSSALSIGLDPDLCFDPYMSDVAAFIATVDSKALDLLCDVQRRVLDAARTPYPFATAAIATELRLHGGPVLAATAILASQACSGFYDKERVARVGEVVEFLAVFEPLMSRLGERANGSLRQLNDALAVMVADFTASKSMCAVAELGPRAVRDLALVASRICEGGMLDASDRFDLERSTERHLISMQLRLSELFAFAAGTAARLTGAGPLTVEGLRRYGHHLGVAYGLSQELIDLCGSDGSHRALAVSLRHGRYSLPILLALGERPELRKAVTGGLRSEDLPLFVDTVRAAGCIEKVNSILHENLVSAKVALMDAAPVRGADLLALIDWVGQRARHVVEVSMPAI